jgi:hypothetical protein
VLGAERRPACTLWYSAWLAGQKKNTRMTAICGAISSQGNQPDLNSDAFFHGA